MALAVAVGGPVVHQFALLVSFVQGGSILEHLFLNGVLEPEISNLGNTFQLDHPYLAFP